MFTQTSKPILKSSPQTLQLLFPRAAHSSASQHSPEGLTRAHACIAVCPHPQHLNCNAVKTLLAQLLRAETSRRYASSGLATDSCGGVSLEMVEVRKIDPASPPSAKQALTESSP